MTLREYRLLPATASIFLASLLSSARGEIPTVLTDAIYQGSGVIDLMKDVTGAELKSYIDGESEFYLGIDLNENASGNESSDSMGVAIKSIEFHIVTTDGDFTFTDFNTNTTAQILEKGSTVPAEYYTVFGETGSNSINGSTTGFDLSTFDDVIRLNDVSVSGEITSATLSIEFLETSNSGGSNEEFFDFSAGFEDFAILAESDAGLLESADIGMESTDATVSYTTTDEGGAAPVAAASPPPAAPAPPLTVCLVAALLAGGYLSRARRRETGKT